MLQDHLLITVALLLAACGAAIMVLVRSKRSGVEQTASASTPDRARRLDDHPVGTARPADTPTPWADPVFDKLAQAVHRHAFGLPRWLVQPILAEHEAVVDRASRELRDAATRREYFPRKPQVVPRLLSAMRNTESSLKDLVDIIMQDPVLTGDVIRMANSAYYRVSREPVETIGRAIVTLGTDGLRALVADSVMQPVFQVPRGYFEQFSPTVWRQAQHAAAAAQMYARTTRTCDSFAAHLLALLFHMSHIVIFRVTVASYVNARGSLPRADVFARLIDERAEALACAIAREWELPVSLIDALEEQVEHRSIDTLTPLARALYVGRICGSAIIAAGDGAIEDEELLALLERKQLTAEDAGTIWEATKALERTEN